MQQMERDRRLERPDQKPTSKNNTYLKEQGKPSPGFPYPSPQEKSGESEATREGERTSIFRWLRDRGLLIYMTAALSVATPFKHERLEAAEIPSGST
jgi:hypothetical protein